MIQAVLGRGWTEIGQHQRIEGRGKSCFLQASTISRARACQEDEPAHKKI
jgi:hypothetical protein